MSVANPNLFWPDPGQSKYRAVINCNHCIVCYIVEVPIQISLVLVRFEKENGFNLSEILLTNVSCFCA